MDRLSEQLQRTAVTILVLIKPMQSSFPWTVHATDSLTRWWDKTTYKVSTLVHNEVLYTLSYRLPTFNYI